MPNAGPCCICGLVGSLTFEHVPPRAAFNDKRIFEADVRHLLEGKWAPDSGAPSQGKYRQKGAGRYSLCGKCNNDTGSWYGHAYVDFAQQAMRLVAASKGAMSLAYPYQIYPLRVLKQIVVMFISACGPGLQAAHPDLVRFVLNKESQELPSRIGLYAYLHHPTLSTAIRQSGLTGVASLDGKSHLFSEIAFPPFGLLLSIDRPPIDARLLDISFFKEYRYTHRQTVFLTLPVFPVVSWLPGDFRTVDEINRTVASNERLGSYHLNQAIPG